jgi:hypothetical protein
VDRGVRDAIARIEVVRDGMLVRSGTGFVVGVDLVLTAFQVVGDKHATPARLLAGVIHLTFPSDAATATVIADAWNAEEDWALLRTDNAMSAKVRPLALASLGNDKAEWETYGFPEAQPNAAACSGPGRVAGARS